MPFSEHFKRFNFRQVDPRRILHFPPEARSDLRTDVVVPPPDERTSWHDGLDDDTNKHWRGWVGTFIAENLGMDLQKPWHISNFLEGYTLVRVKRRNALDRPGDTHLYGHGGRSTFRSPQEFAFHAVWLYDRHYHDTAPCECCLCTGRKQGEIEEAWFDSPPKLQRQTDAETTRASIPQPTGMPILTRRPRLTRWINIKQSLVREPTMADLREYELSLVCPYRVGELVWVSIPPIAPAEQANQEEEIRFWPALVEGMEQTTARRRPSTPNRRSDPAYSVRLLGVDHRHVVPFSRILSWRAYTLPGIIKEQIADPAMPVRVHYMLLELKHIPVLETTSIDNRIKSDDMARTFGNVLAPLSLAILAAELISSWYSVTDDYVGRFTGSPKCYQGIWWGAERIWVDDLVRLSWSRQVLEQDLRGAGLDVHLEPSTRDAETRQLMARIREINFDDRRKMFSFASELYELEDVGVGLEDLPHHTPLGTDDTGLPQAPIGFRFRRLTVTDQLIYLPIEGISGRYDPLPLESSAHRELLGIVTANNVKRLRRLPPAERQQADESLMRLLFMSGLQPDDAWNIVRPELAPREKMTRRNIVDLATESARARVWERNRARANRERQRQQEQERDGDAVMME